MEEQPYIVLEVQPRDAPDDSFRFGPRGGERAEGAVVTVQPLSPSDVRDVRRAPGLIAAPSVPLRLVEPVAKVEAKPAAELSPTWGVAAVGATEGDYSGVGVRVAVLDTGIDAAHPAFTDLEVTQHDFTGEGDGDTDGHGTHCAGTIGGGVVDGWRIGVAPGLDELLIGKVLGREGGSTDALAQGMLWALNAGANVISMSLGIDFPGLVAFWTQQGLPVEPATSRALQGYRDNLRLFEAIADLIGANALVGREALVVAATGNESRRRAEVPYTIDVSPPAAAEGFISVGALEQASDGTLHVADFSNTGAALAAPGVEIVSAATGGGLVAMSGTSMATPHAAGVAALWAEHLIRSSGRVDAEVLAGRLRGTSRQVPGLSLDDAGVGLVQGPGVGGKTDGS